MLDISKYKLDSILGLNSKVLCVMVILCTVKMLKLSSGLNLKYQFLTNLEFETSNNDEGL